MKQLCGQLEVRPLVSQVSYTLTTSLCTFKSLLLYDDVICNLVSQKEYIYDQASWMSTISSEASSLRRLTLLHQISWWAVNSRLYSTRIYPMFLAHGGKCPYQLLWFHDLSRLLRRVHSIRLHAVALLEQAVFLDRICLSVYLPVPEWTDIEAGNCAVSILIILAAHELPFARSGSVSGVESPSQSTGSTEVGSLRMLSMSAFPTNEQFTFSEKVKSF